MTSSVVSTAPLHQPTQQLSLARANPPIHLLLLCFTHTQTQTDGPKHQQRVESQAWVSSCHPVF